MRPPREDYVRVTVTFGRFTYEPAVEWRAGDRFTEIAGSLQGCALAASLDGNYAERRDADSMRQANKIAEVIAAEWPDRAYFVEVWQEGREGFAQVFQPFGVPRNQCA